MQEEHTYDLGLLEQSAQKWRSSTGLQLVYADIYREIADHLPDGPALELGSGIGNGKEFIPHLVTSDIDKTPYVDRAENAYDISPDNSGQPWAGIIAVDVLHHLRKPFAFFASASKALRPGGRILLTEPAATAFGRIFYGLFHHEPMQPALIQPPFEFAPNGPGEEFANMGMGVGLFRRKREETDKRLADIGLRAVSITCRDVLAYPLSGGYSKPQLLPTPVIKAILAADKSLPQCILKRTGLRMLIVIEKNATTGN